MIVDVMKMEMGCFGVEKKGLIDVLFEVFKYRKSG